MPLEMCAHRRGMSDSKYRRLALADGRGHLGKKQIPSGNDNQKRSSRGRSTILPWALGVALLDTGGNMLFVAATRLGRLDVAAVLASLYPAGTILLAAWQLHERPTRRQFAGMLAALAAVAMITL